MTFFSPEEDRCKCGRPECPAPRVVQAAFQAHRDELRVRLGRPLLVRSGIRCEFWNAREGGETPSAHVTACATDFSAETGREKFQLVAGAICRPDCEYCRTGRLFTRIGVGKSFVHVDASTDPHHPAYVLWAY